jgi:hypothetical protein
MILPLTAYLCFSLFTPNAEAIIRLSGQYFQVKLSLVGLLIVLVNTLPYLTHYFLRNRNAREPIQAHFHVIVCLLLSIVLLFAYAMVPHYDTNWNRYVFGRPGDGSFSFLSKLITTSWWMLFIVHVIFMTYALYRIFGVVRPVEQDDDFDSLEPSE